MPYEPFHERFPEVAKRETRTIIAINDPDLPEGEYGLIEAYCNEPNCDCRRVFFNVYSWQTQEMLAVIAYGWESREYYVQWFGQDDPRVIPDLQGPILNSTSHQSDLAPVLLEKVKYTLQDKRYVARLKRHYKMFRESVDDQQREKTRRSVRVSRNAPCPCGSGKKYKRLYLWVMVRKTTLKQIPDVLNHGTADLHCPFNISGSPPVARPGRS